MRILVVDDQETVRLLVSETVRWAGHEVIGLASDGMEAVALALDLHPDVVVMDVSMPRMNGIEAMHQMLEAGIAGRILLMSGGYNAQSFPLAELPLEARFLPKPFDIDEFTALLTLWQTELGK